jgi:hypothetical protein
MSAITYGAGFLLTMSAGILYKRYKEKDAQQNQMDDYDFVKKYLLTESSLAKVKKPILWIPLQFEYNTRHWQSFGSRGSTCMNKPYMELCIRSIIEQCGDDFQVCLVDDAAFNKILPGWSIRIQDLPNPIKTHMRYLALSKMLYAYGGMIVPPSFICTRNIYSVYSLGLSNSSMFVGEFQSKSNVMTNFFPSMEIMGCNKNCNVMKRFISYLETAISSDYTNEMEFNGGPDKWLYKEVIENRIMLISGNLFGIKDIYSEPISLETLMGDGDAKFDKNMIGIYIPESHLSSHTKYNWFDRLSHEQVLESDTLIGKYLLVSNDITS